jgi:hypothetical protein
MDAPVGCPAIMNSTMLHQAPVAEPLVGPAQGHGGGGDEACGESLDDAGALLIQGGLMAIMWQRSRAGH